MPKLTDSQRVVLSAAAQRPDGAVLPLPNSLKLNKAASTKVLASLLKRDLLAECPATSPESIWRQPKDGPGVTLAITEAGLKAIGVEPKEAMADEPTARLRRRSRRRKQSARRPVNVATPTAPRSGTKQALLVEMLSCKHGASIAEIIEAAGWQPHTVRGAISGALKKKLGLTVASEKTERRGRVYRIVDVD